MFILNQFYKTKNGSKVVCELGPNTHGLFRFRIISGGHGINWFGKTIGEKYMTTSEGKYVNGNNNPEDIMEKLSRMDIVGLWDDRLEKTEGWVSEQDMSSILSEQNLIKSAVSAIGKRRRRKLDV